MVDAPAEARIEAIAPPAARLSANDVGTDDRCLDRAKLDEDLGKRLFKDENTTLGLIGDAGDLRKQYPEMTFEQALVKALEDGKERVADEQKERRDRGEKTPPLGEMLVSAGLVTQKQVDRALEEQANRKPAPRLGDLLVEQLKANIAEVQRQQNCKK